MKAAGFLRKPLLFLGIDRAIGYTLVGRVWYVLAGPVTLFFIAAFLSPEEQGFYYTFGSLLALNVFFELGLAFVILQFASHEKAHLEWSADGTLNGNPEAKARLASLLRLSLVWYGVVAVIIVATLLPVGLIFFQRGQPLDGGIFWQLPWAGVVLASAGALCLSVRVHL